MTPRLHTLPNAALYAVLSFSNNRTLCVSATACTRWPLGFALERDAALRIAVERFPLLRLLLAQTQSVPAPRELFLSQARLQAPKVEREYRDLTTSLDSCADRRARTAREADPVHAGTSSRSS